MAGGLPKKRSEFERIDGTHIAIIASQWHPQCVNAMVERARTELTELGCKDIEIHYLPGSFELPMAARFLFTEKPELDAILAFGVVLKGATTHDQMVLQETASGFSRVMHEMNKPIVNEVIGVTNIEDAVKRSGTDDWNKGLEAAFAVSEVLSWRKKIRSK